MQTRDRPTVVSCFLVFVLVLSVVFALFFHLPRYSNLGTINSVFMVLLIVFKGND